MDRTQSFHMLAAATLLGVVLCGCSSNDVSSAYRPTYTAARPDTGPPAPAYAALPSRHPGGPSAIRTRSNAYTNASGASGVGYADSQRQGVDLPTVMRLATGRNLDVKIVREKLREAHADMVNAGWWALPSIRPAIHFNKVDGNVQATEGAIVDVDKNNAFVGGGVFVDWEIGDAIYDNLAAVQRARGTQHMVQANLNDASLLASEGYFDLLRSQTALVIAEDNVKLYEQLAAETQAQVEAGGGFRGDVLRARARLSHARVEQRKAEQANRAAALRLREVLNMPSSVELFATEKQPVKLEMINAGQSEDELLRQALVGRSEIRHAEAHAKAALAERRKTTVGPWIPRVTAGWEGGGFGHNLNRLGGTSDVGVGMSWEIGRDGIGGKARQASAAARERQSRIQIQQVRQAIVRQVGTARGEAMAQAQAMEAAEVGVKDAQEALNLYRERQQVGVGIPLDAIVAQEVLAEARLDYLDAVIGFNKAQMRLLHAVGTIGQ